MMSRADARADAREVIRARGHFSRAFAVFFACHTGRQHQIEISLRTKDRVGVTFRCGGN